MELFLLYVWTRLNAISGALLAATLLSGFMLLFAAGRLFIDEKEDARPYLATAKFWFFVFGALFVFTPSQKDAATIAGGWLVKEASQSEIAKSIGERTYKLIVGKLDEELAKLEPKDKK